MTKAYRKGAIGALTDEYERAERGANPNIADARGWTAMHQAASRGNERVMKAILAAGGDPSRIDKEGGTPIDIARVNGREKIGALLRQ